MEDMRKVYSVTPPGLMIRQVSGKAEDMSDKNDFDKHLDHLPIGMAYVPRQQWRDIYDNGKALMRGTIFAELDKPFKGGCGK